MNAAPQRARRATGQQQQPTTLQIGANKEAATVLMVEAATCAQDTHLDWTVLAFKLPRFHFIA